MCMAGAEHPRLVATPVNRAVDVREEDRLRVRDVFCRGRCSAHGRRGLKPAGFDSGGRGEENRQIASF